MKKNYLKAYISMIADFLILHIRFFHFGLQIILYNHNIISNIYNKRKYSKVNL